MKRVFLAVPALLVVCVGILVVAPGFVDWNSYKSQVQEQAKAAAGINLDLKGNLGFSILPSPRLVAEGIHVLSADGGQDIAKLERFEVRLSLLPLLSGNISVDSVSLVRPEIYVEKSKEGEMNIASLLSTGAKEKQSEPDQKTNPDTASALPAVSLKDVVIEDGKIQYLDQKSGQKTSLEKINMNLSADSITGPFKAQGSLSYSGNTLILAADIPALDVSKGVTDSRISASILPYGVDLTYGGAIRFEDGVSLQGVLGLEVKDIIRSIQSAGGKGDGIIPSALSMKGIVTANTDKFMLQDIAMILGQSKVEGNISVSLQDQNVLGALKTIGDIDLGTILQSAPFKKIAMDIKFSGSQKDITLKDSALKLDGQQIALSGFYAAGAGEKPAYIAAKIEADNLDFDAIQQSLKGKSDSVVVDEKSNSAFSGEASSNKIVAGGVLPFDLALQASVKNLKYAPYTFRDMSFDISTSGQALKITNFLIGNLDGSQISLSGVVRDVENISGVNVVFDLKTENAKALAKLAGIDPQTLPETLDTAKIKAKITGSKDSIDTTANVSALEGDFIFQGNISKPLDSPVLSGVAVQVKHPKMAKLIETFAGVQETDPNLQKPLDVYAKISQAGKVYTLSEINGNLSGATVQGAMKLDLSAAKPDIQGNLVFGDIHLDPQITSKGKASSAKDGKSSSGRQSSASGSGSGGSRWSKEPISTAFLNSCNLKLDISAQNLKYGVWPLQQPKISLDLKDGTLGISTLQAKLFEGSILMNATVQSVQQERQPIHISGNATLENVSLLPLIEALSGSQLVKANGRVSSDIEIKSSGISPAALVYDLGGKGTITGQNIVLEGVDVARFARALSDESKPGDTALGIWKGSTQGGSTAFDTLDGNFAIAEGIVNIAKLDLDGSQAAIYTTGKINLPDWTLATKHRMVAKTEAGVDPAFPPFEVSFSGSLDNPAQTFGQGLLDDYLGRKVQRKLDKLLTDKLGLGGKEPSQATQDATQAEEETVPAEQTQGQPAEDQSVTPEQQQELDPEEAVKGILKGLLR